MMRFHYELLSYGVYRLHMTTYSPTHSKEYVTPIIMGFRNDAEEEIKFLYSLSIKERFELHDWKEI